MEETPLLRKYLVVLVGALLLSGLYVSSLYNYLLFHSLAEMFSIAVAFGIFMVAWNSRRFMDNNYLLFLGVAYLFIGSLDFIHTLGYRGMGVFPGHHTNLATQLWISARYLEAFSLAAAPFFLGRKVRTGAVFAAYAAVTALVLVSIFAGFFPVCFIEGQGLTPFKKVSEYVISLILAVSGYLLYRKRAEFDPGVFRLIIASIVLTIGSELAFTSYVSAYGVSNLVGHYLKIVSFYLIYRALIKTGLVKPYDLLFRNLKASEAKYRSLFENMLEASALHRVVLDDVGQPVDYVFLEVNDAFERLTGLMRENVIGRRATEAIPGIERSSFDWIREFGKVALTGSEAKFEQYSEALRRWYAGSAYSPEKGYFVSIFKDVTDRKKAEDMLRFTEYSVESSAVAAYWADEEGALVNFNDAACGLLGYTKEELRGLKVFDVYCEYSARDWAELWRELVLRGSKGFEALHRARDGRVFPVEVDANYFYYHGRDYCFSYVRDISDRKQADEALRSYRAHLEEAVRALKIKDSAIASSINAMAMADLEGRLTYVNEAFLRFWGYEGEEEVLGRQAVTFWQDEQGAEGVLRTVLQSGDCVGELVGKKKDGSPFDVRLSASLVRDAAGEPVCLMASFIDITEKNKAQREAEEGYGILRALMENVPEGITIAESPDVRIRMVSRHGVELSGRARNTLEGSAVGEHPDDWQIYRPDGVTLLKPEELPLSRATRHGEVVTNEELVMKRADGARIPILCNAGPIRDADGNITGGVIAWRDIRDLKRAEEHVRLNEARLEALLALSRMFDASLDEISAFAVEQAVRLTRSGIGFLGLLDGEEEVLTSFARSAGAGAACAMEDQPVEFSVAGGGIWAEAVRRRRPVIINDYSAFHPAKKGLPPGHAPISRLLCAPIRDGDRIVAVAAVANKEADYDEVDVNQLVLLMNGMWARMKIKEAEDALRIKESAIASSINAIAFCDLEGKVTYVNDSVLRMWGYRDRGEVLGRPVTDFWSDRKDALKIIQSLYHAGSWTGEHQARRKDGSSFDVQLSASIVRDSAGNPARLMASFMDITIRKRAEEELRRHRDRLGEMVNERTGELQAAIELLREEVLEREQAEEALAEEKERLAVTLRSIGEGVITTDIEGRVMLVNAAAEELTGWTNDEARGMPLERVFLLVDERTRLQVLEDPVAKVLDTGRPVGLSNHSVLISKGGKERTVSSSGAPIHDRNGEVIGIVLVFRDVTERQKMEQELTRAQRLESLGVLAGGIAHDFNNVLAAIVNNVSLAKMSINPGDKAYRRLDAAERACMRAQGLTRQLLTFSRGGAPVRKTASLAELIEESVSFALQGSNVRCEYAVSEDLRPVEIDEGQISQVIGNLVINADQAMPGGGLIKVRAENFHVREGCGLPLRCGKYVRLSVEDSGTGIHPEHLERIFDPYFSTKQKGSGLGLATTYSIIRNHDGHISVESKLGEGTTFHIYLPASEREIEARGQAKAVAPDGGGRVLVMDDEEEIRESLGAVLDHFGFEAEFAGDGVEAIEVYRRAIESGRPFDAVIMDLTIPGGMGGMEAFRQLRDMDPGIKAVVSSGYSTNPVMSDYAGYGFKGVVSKPYLVQDLVRLLQDVIKGA